MMLRSIYGALVLSLVASSPTWAAQPLATGQEVAIPWLRLIGALTLCIGLAAAAAIALRHRGGLKAWPQGLFSALRAPHEATPPRLVETAALRLSNSVHVTLFTVDGAPWMAAVSTTGQVTLVRSGEDRP